MVAHAGAGGDDMDDDMMLGMKYITLEEPHLTLSAVAGAGADDINNIFLLILLFDIIHDFKGGVRNDYDGIEQKTITYIKDLLNRIIK